MPTGVYQRKLSMTTEQFVEKAQAVHGDRFDYSKTVFAGSGKHVKIRCKKHDIEFDTPACNHLKGHVGCRECSREKKIGNAGRFEEKVILKVGYKKDRLTVIREPYNKPNKNGKLYKHVLVKCDCGKESEMLKCNFLKPTVQSCGCLGREKRNAYNETIMLNLVGKRFGKLTVLADGERDKSGQRAVTVRCSCGADPFVVRSTALTTGNTKACYVCRITGKLGRQRKSLVGQVFGKLTVLKDWGSKANGQSLSLCHCECGEQTIVQNNNLHSGNTTGCVGCKTAGSDSVEKFLADAELADSDCYFYIAKVNGKYVKPGITWDPPSRAKSAGVYDSYHFVSPVLTRCEAWSIEQTMLRETKDAQPKDLSDIDPKYLERCGPTELRLKDVYPPEQLEHRFWELLRELQSVGCWLTFYEKNN